MYDDGTHGDAVGGDGIYTGTIPAGTATAGQMLRWYVTATDTLAHSGRWPLLVPIIGNDGGPEYQGTVIADPTLTSTLPIFQSFIVNPAAADNWSDRTGSRGLGLLFGPVLRQRFRLLPRRLYDAWKQVQIQFRLRFHFCGRSRSRQSDQSEPAGVGRVLMPGPKLLSTPMSAAGVPASIVFPIRVQRNNAYYMVMNFIEQVNDQLLEREGIYKNGAIYKGNTDVMSDSSSAYFTKLNRDEVSGTDDLQQFLNGLHLTDLTARRKFIYDNVNIPVMLDYLAANTLVHGQRRRGEELLPLLRYQRRRQRHLRLRQSRRHQRMGHDPLGQGFDLRKGSTVLRIIRSRIPTRIRFSAIRIIRKSTVPTIG